MSIWQFQRKLSNRLMLWGVFSIITGVLMLGRSAFWRGVAAQFISWGAIDAGIALFGQKTAQSRKQKLANPDAPETVQKETSALSQLLWLNTGLDILYVFGGRWLACRKGGFVKGSGWGVIIQGGFLFFFDLFHALKVNRHKKS